MLHISPTTERLAGLVAKKTGMTPEEVVREAVQEHARAAGLIEEAVRSDASPFSHAFDGQQQNRRSRTEMIAGMEAISSRSAARPLADDRSIDEIIGYDDIGLPR